MYVHAQAIRRENLLEYSGNIITQTPLAFFFGGGGAEIPARNTLAPFCKAK